MPTLKLVAACLALSACGGAVVAPAPAPAGLPPTVSVFDSRTGAPIEHSVLLARLAGADFVLLGELHDNAVHHQVRGLLIRAMSRPPGVVFEQFAATDHALPAPPGGAATDEWLDANGFDRKAWKWPLHSPVVEAALASGRSIWGSGVSREALRAVVMEGARKGPEPLWRMMESVPLDSAAQAAMDHELVVGHCNQLPATMIPGMRAAQEIRDASMTRALLAASAEGGAAWLVAGNGHVRSDIAVPRLLRATTPERSVLVVGLLESTADGKQPDLQPERYDLAIVTPPATRADPCATMGRP